LDCDGDYRSVCKRGCNLDTPAYGLYRNYFWRCDYEWQRIGHWVREWHRIGHRVGEWHRIGHRVGEWLSILFWIGGAQSYGD